MILFDPKLWYNATMKAVDICIKEFIKVKSASAFSEWIIRMQKRWMKLSLPEKNEFVKQADERKLPLEYIAKIAGMK